MVHKAYPKIYLMCKVGYAHCKGLYGLFFMLYVIIHISMYYSNKCLAQLFCIHEQSAGGKGAVWYVCELLILKTVNNVVYDTEKEIYVRIMNNVHY